MSSEPTEKSSPESPPSPLSTPPSSSTKSFSETWADFKNGAGKLCDSLEAIDIKESVRARREQLNNAIEKNFLLAESIKVAMHPEVLMKDIHAGLYEVSTTINSKFPYQASLCRTHDYLLISTAVVFVSFPMLRVSKKYAFVTAILTGAFAKSATSVVNYKWDYPKEEQH